MTSNLPEHHRNPTPSSPENESIRPSQMRSLEPAAGHWKFNQLRAALLMESVLLIIGFGFTWSFWRIWCPSGVEQCLGHSALAPAHYLLLSILRPFVLTPQAFGVYLAARSFSPEHAVLLSILASFLSALPIYGLGYLIGKHLVVPWMSSNLPSTLRFIKTQDYKIILATRLIPIFPFDLVSLLAGIFSLNFKRFSIYTILGIVPECLFLTLLSSPKISFGGFTFNAVVATAVLILTPLIVLEWLSRKKGRSLWNTGVAAYQEIMKEARLNNQIVKRNKIDPSKTPVLLLYGFFSSRRSVSLLERQLVNAGFDVLTFNLGGMFGTFFTQGVTESAAFVNYKMQRQIDRHGIKKIHIVAHSKGTLVAYWWLMRLGGAKYCDKLIAMASPCAGSYYTYLALVTPLAFFWRDMWQMRPGSSFLSLLKELEVPPNLKIWSLYSEKDTLARGAKGLFRPRLGAEHITVVGMHNYNHFDFILRRGAIKEVIKILRDEPLSPSLAPEEYGASLSQLTGDAEFTTGTSGPNSKAAS